MRLAKHCEDVEVFIENNKEPNDTSGYSTMLMGLLCSNNNKNIVSLATDSMIYCAKAVEKGSDVSGDALTASLLWSTVKGMDIIVIPFYLSRYTASLKEIVQKAYESNTLMFTYAPRGRCGNELSESPYVISVNYVIGEKFGIDKKSTERKLIISLPGKLYTTYLDNKFVLAPPEISSLSIATSLAALMIEENPSFDEPGEIYTKLVSLKKV